MSGIPLCCIDAQWAPVVAMIDESLAYRELLSYWDAFGSLSITEINSLIMQIKQTLQRLRRLLIRYYT